VRVVVFDDIAEADDEIVADRVGTDVELVKIEADADAEADAEDFAVKEGVDLLDKLDIGVLLDDTVDDIVGATVTVTLVEAELDDEVLGDGDVEDESDA
jgi:hypothetical protein